MLLNQKTQLSPEDIEAARDNIVEALELTGGLHCHDCGDTRPQKVQVRRSKKGPYVKCWRCGWVADAIGLLTEDGSTFRQAVNTLLGRDDTPVMPVRPVVRKRTPVVIPERFEAVLDTRVYSAIANTSTPGVVSAAGVWLRDHHIPSHVGIHYGTTYIEDAAALGDYLDKEFGHDVCAAAGLTSTHGKWLFEGDYNLVETHTAPSGVVFGIQFRATGAAALDAKQHKMTKNSEHPSRFVPHVLALRGGTPRHLIGCGLDKVAHAPTGTVHIVEGYKDMLAAAALGMLAYALPGAANVPPKAALPVLARHQVVLSLDDDAAGHAGADQLEKWFADNGVPTTRLFPPDGGDWADALVAKNRQQNR